MAHGKRGNAFFELKKFIKAKMFINDVGKQFKHFGSNVVYITLTV